MKPEEMIEFWQQGDKIVDLKIGGRAKDKYAMLTVERNGNKLLFSKGWNVDCILGRPEVINGLNKFYPISNQTGLISFEEVFLFKQVSFAIDRKHQLWILGGVMPIKD